MSRYRASFFALTLLPILVVGLGSLWGMDKMLQGIASSVNKQEELRTGQAMHSAFHGLEQQFSNLILDNAPWDEAIKNTYGEPNQEWVEDTWGTATLDENYDTSFVLNGDGQVISAYQFGEAVKFLPKDYFGKELEGMLQLAFADNTQRIALSTIISTSTPNTFSVIGLGRILPGSDGESAPSDRPNILIFSKQISPEMLADMATQYAVDDLQLLPLSTGSPEDRIIKSPTGMPIAEAQWTARDPGLAARNANSFVAFAVVLALMGVLIPVTIAHYRLAQQIQKRESQAQHAARHDSLSGLPNRVQLLERLNHHASTGSTEPLSLLFIDLDGFKAVNDAFDHAAGDALICMFGQGLLNYTKPDDLVARLGGDEFAIILRGADVATRAENLALDIIGFAQRPFDLNGRIASIGASVGIASWSKDVIDSAEFMRCADIAMYAAKDRGRNTFCNFDSTMDADRTEDMLIAGQLRKHLAQSGMRVAYQPIVDSRSHLTTGVEALARWPGTENYAPSRFIRVAEEHGLIHEVFRSVCERAMAEIVKIPEIKLAVNVSALQISNRNLLAEIEAISQRTGFALNRLELEFTESNLIRNSKSAKKLIDELRAKNIRIGLDDFGTGFAGIGYLRDFAFNTIKLDLSLTQAITADHASQQFVLGTTTIAQGLSTQIVAEGVETKEQALFMQLAGCQHLQGYHFAKPMTIEDLLSFVAKGVEVAGEARFAQI